MADNREVTLKAVRSDGQIFEYNSEDWGILTLEGLDFPSFEIFKEDRGFGNGSIITGKRKEARDIDVVARARHRRNVAQNRQNAIGFHNSNYTFDLYISYMGVVRIAKDCQLQGAKCPTGNTYAPLQLTISYLHPESDLLGETSDNTSFVQTAPLWHVTRVYKQGTRLPFSVSEVTHTKWINYLGSEDTYIHVKIEASGLVEGINLSLGEYKLSVDVTLNNNDTLIIDSETKSIIHNGSELHPSKYNGEALPKLMLHYGDNKLTLQANDEGVTAFSAQVNYIGRYGGL